MTGVVEYLAYLVGATVAAVAFGSALASWRRNSVRSGLWDDVA